MHQNMYVKALVLYLLTWITAAYQPLNFSEMKPNSGVGSEGSTFYFPVEGNVYPLGYYTVKISIGNPPKPYVLDIDTGSDLTWVTCDAAPPPPNPYYPQEGVLVNCHDPACIALGELGKDVKDKCTSPPDSSYPCEYEVNYADGGSSSGILVRDWVHLIFRNGSWVSPWIAFGCGYPSKGEVPIHQPINDGVLGLGKGAQGILKQLRDIGVIRNVVGHCLSTQGGGYLFFGDIPLPGIAWKQILHDAEHYFLGSADILLNGEVTDIRDLGIMFDSGSTYTYLHSEAYGALLDLVIKNLNGTLKDAADDNTLPVCWGGPFGSLDEAASHFLPLAFNFTDAKNVHFQMDPKSYLIISGKGNVYLGILNGTEVGLEDMNLIGDISMHDKLVIYDNENGMVGWATVETCNLMF